jgi:hypothetical protein
MKCPQCKIYMTRVIYGEQPNFVYKMQSHGILMVRGWEYEPGDSLWSCSDCFAEYPFVLS